MKTRIIITGMHRSGTSAVAGALARCGVEFGNNLLGPQRENPKGFFEDRRFLEINKEILACSGGSWFNPPVELKVNQGIKEKIRCFVKRWNRYSLAGWKDPRCCLTLPVWADYIDDLRLIYVNRDPREIAMSLAKRNGFREDFSIQLRNVYRSRWNEFIDENPGIQLANINYHDFLRNPCVEIHNALQLLEIRNINPLDFLGELREFVDKKLYRNRI
jgi:hypothetical protein